MLDAEALGLQPVLADAAGGPALDEEESVLHKFERLQLVIGAATDQGEGTLFITEGRIIWLASGAATGQRGYACGFPSVAMHAVVADEASSDRPCLYLQLDSGEEEGGMGGAEAGSSGSEEDGGAEDEEEEASSELRLVPADASQLDALFQAFCEGAERNPDDSEDEEEGAGFFYNEDEALAGAAAAALGVADVQELVGTDPGRFEDADDEEEEEEAEKGQANGGC